MSVTVIKIGGSVLTGLDAYRQAAGFIADRLQQKPASRIAVVVSAEEGVTDALSRTASELCADPDRRTLDLLWSTGELRSVALLVLALHARGIKATGLNVHQAGLVEADGNGSAPPAVRALRVRTLLSSVEVVVVPGFLARTSGDAIASLGRGGSDLTAVVLAAALGADTCELVKDVAGYFAADPNVDSRAAHLPAVDYDKALAMADAGCELVQARALEAARATGLPLIVRNISNQRYTLVYRG